MTGRMYFPTDPVRWVHHRRGSMASRQHVVAKPTGGPVPWVQTLCGVTISDGRLGSEFRSKDERGWGPKSRRPLVTVRPDPAYRLCPRCAHALLACEIAAANPPAVAHA